eukprot:scaffold258197_cov32-Prasinocladus_malaysianus.AAC.1
MGQIPTCIDGSCCSGYDAMNDTAWRAENKLKEQKAENIASVPQRLSPIDKMSYIIAIKSEVVGRSTLG